MRERINAEFDTPRIRETLNAVAKQKYSEELQRLMAAEVAKQVAEELKRQEPFIRQTITTETARQLKGRAAPRVLHDLVRKDLIAVLKAKHPVRFYIDCVGTLDSEACAYAKQYLAIFQSAGWKDFVQLRSVPSSGKRFWDVTILVRDAEHPPTAATALVQFFEQAWPDASFPIESDPIGSSDIPRLLIPPKPL